MVILSELCVVIISSGGGKWLANAVKQTLFWIRAGQNNSEEALYFLVSNLQFVLPLIGAPSPIQKSEERKWSSCLGRVFQHFYVLSDLRNPLY